MADPKHSTAKPTYSAVVSSNTSSKTTFSNMLEKAQEKGKQDSDQEQEVASTKAKHKRKNRGKKNKSKAKTGSADQSPGSSTTHTANQKANEPRRGKWSKNGQGAVQDEHSWMVHDETTWNGLKKRVDAKFTQSTKNFPALPTKTTNNQPSVELNQVVSISLSSNSNAITRTVKKTKPRSSEDAKAKTQALTKPCKTTGNRQASAWDKPINIPLQIQDKPQPVKSVPKANVPWDTDEMVAWAHNNLPIKTRISFLKNYYANPQEVYSKRGEPKHTTALFPRFGEMPYEIRSQIWQVYLEEISKGQTVRLKVHYEDVEFGVPAYSFHARSGESPLLRVNQETRDIALKHYSKVFASNSHPATTYFNFRKDKLFLHTRGPCDLEIFVNSVNAHDCKRIRCLIIPLRAWVFSTNHDKFCSWLAKFRRCAAIQFVTGNGLTEAPYRDDPGFGGMLLERLEPHWRRNNGPERPMPTFRFHVIDALHAKGLRIDNLEF
ncbi:hypothetical protein PVAG01_05877 [Phlyctema vagabunda]|uniref:2EXR domain-containing protein n=1 Tax=Phlyctema vagabunda TaxID=108571 RepID=A0ABR4PEH5_9HELO